MPKVLIVEDQPAVAKFARLPLPRKARVRWDEVLDEARRFYPFQLEGAHPGEGVFDRTQIQQVLINLLKNRGVTR